MYPDGSRNLFGYRGSGFEAFIRHMTEAGNICIVCYRTDPSWHGWRGDNADFHEDSPYYLDYTLALTPALVNQVVQSTTGQLALAKFARTTSWTSTFGELTDEQRDSVSVAR